MLIQSPQSPAEWTAYYDLRFRVLREPWGQPPGSERAPDDDAPTTVHGLLLDASGAALAVGRLNPDSATEGQVRFMAVAPQSQGQGLGARMLRYLEEQALRGGLTSIILHAREAAVPFYQKLGYSIVQPSHTLFGQIPHFLMRKELSSETGGVPH